MKDAEWYCNAGGFHVMLRSRSLLNLGHDSYGSQMGRSALGCNLTEILFWSIFSGTSLFSEILAVEHTEAESWHGHFRELEPNIFRRISPVFGADPHLNFPGDLSIKIQARNLWSFEFQNEDSDVTRKPPGGPFKPDSWPSCGQSRSSRWLTTFSEKLAQF